MECSICNNSGDLIVEGVTYCWECVNFCNGCGKTRHHTLIVHRNANEVQCMFCASLTPQEMLAQTACGTRRAPSWRVG